MNSQIGTVVKSDDEFGMVGFWAKMPGTVQDVIEVVDEGDIVPHGLQGGYERYYYLYVGPKKPNKNTLEDIVKKFRREIGS